MPTSVQITDRLYCILATAIASTDNEQLSRTELDSHANMPVVGMNCTILRQHGRTVDVRPFTPDYAPMLIPLVDAAVLYQCPFSGEEYIFIIMNALHVPSMQNNLISPFIIRDVGTQVKETPKIQCAEPDESDHDITFDANLRVPLYLHGIFSYFTTSKPTVDQIESIEDVYLLTPESFNPHDVAYSLNEESMLDWKGNMVDKRDRQ